MPANREGASFVSTVRPTRGQTRAAWAAALISAAVFAAAAPFARVPLPQLAGFLPVYQSAMVAFDMVTVVLLLGQFSILRNRGLLLLASGYLFSAFMAVAHALSFPGLFAGQGGLIGGPQSTAWIYFLWHGGFPLFVIGYGIYKPGLDRAPREMASYRGILFAIALAALAALACTFVAVSLHDSLPRIMVSHSDAPTKLVVATATWLIGIVALAVIWRRRPYSVLDLWLMVVLCVWTADTALAAVLNHARWDLGWYAGRGYGLLASGFVLAVLLLESGALYARLARTNRMLEQKSEALELTMTDLQLANRDLQAFAGTLAHDLQQPLTTITAFSQVMQRDAHMFPAEDAAHLAKIAAAAQTARVMIRALLEFARLGQAQPAMAPVDLNQVIGEARSAVTAFDSRRVEWRVGPLPTVRGDAALLLLAFINLLSNALKYTRHRANAVISIDATQHDAERWEVRVADNGVGFDMAHTSRLFRPFERLHTSAEFEGTGMGLANVRRIMEKHGTSIRAEGMPGAGAVFTLQLPSVGEGPAPRNPGSSSPASAIAAARAAAPLP